MLVESFFSRRPSGIETAGPIKEEVYEMPTMVVFGRGAIRELGDNPFLKDTRKALIVTGGHFRESKDFSRLVTNLERHGIEVVGYNERIRKSDFKAVNRLSDFVRREKPEVVIAVGGGTIIDTAKCAAILARNDGSIENHVRDKTKQLKNKGITFVAVPTTSGTGSEVTPWATVWDEKNKEKYSLTSLFMFPNLAVVDPSLTDSLPPHVTAESGIDALTQAVEAFWSVKHNPVSDKFAIESIKLALKYLEKVVNNPDKTSRDKIAKASLLAGLAFSNTQTTICHSVSYPMTAHFGVAHGQAVAITLPLFLEYSTPVLGENRRNLLFEALGIKNGQEGKEKIMALMKKIGLKTKLSELGVTKEDIDIIVQKGFHPDRAKNAPRIPTPEELKTILQRLL